MYGQNNISSLKGVEDSLVVVSVNALREANIKLVERKALKEVCAQQDTIILNQQSIIDNYKSYNLSLINTNLELTKDNSRLYSINADIEKRLNRSKTYNYIISGVSISVIIFTIINFTVGGK